MDPRESHPRRLDRRQFLATATTAPLLTLPFARSAVAQTPAAEGTNRWESWADEITVAPSGLLCWRALSFRAHPIEEAEFINRPLGFVWNYDGRYPLIVENETQGSTRQLDSNSGPRAVSFNHDQDSEARGLGDDEDPPPYYRYYNFDLTQADTYMSTRGDAEIAGWSSPFTARSPELRLSFGSLTLAPRERASYVTHDQANPHPVFVMCHQGTISALNADWKTERDLDPGDFVELSPESPIAMLYGRAVNSVLVGLHSPDAGTFQVDPPLS